jgi:hypothetical protein
MAVAIGVEYVPVSHDVRLGFGPGSGNLLARQCIRHGGWLDRCM